MSKDHTDKEEQLTGRGAMKRFGRWGVSLATFSLNVGIAAAAVLIGITTIQMRAEEKPKIEASPLVQVPVTRPEYSPGYDVAHSFVGRVEPGRQTDLGFELSGTIDRITVDEGDVVRKGDVIAELDRRTLEAERRRQLANRLATESDRELAVLTLGRQQKLKDGGHVSAQILDQARLTVSRLDATLAQIDATIEAIDINLDKSVLTAPFDGIVGERLLDEGATVSPGMPLLKILEATSPTVRIGLAPEVVDRLDRDDKFEVRVSGEAYAARLSGLRPDLQTSTRTIETLFEIDLGSGPARFGRLAELTLPERIETEGFWVPTAALKEGPGGLWTVLAVVEEDAQEGGDTFTISREAVEVLHAGAVRSFVRGTITRDTRIVTEGVHRVVPGQSVTPIENGA
ncbi:efflux RND transporter periplasmic adaptor subunit [Roseibium sp. SCP14]|uniref:efflux RND transporter periplasmic adaptor subunit n=1 Tax=Roseibium sp. SCP14 TaxID=3141375 RepID=UPI003336FAFB